MIYSATPIIIGWIGCLTVGIVAGIIARAVSQ